jgi:mycothiol synthase
MAPTVELVSELDDDTVAHARRTLERALPPGLRDDRFDEPWVQATREGRSFLAARCGGEGPPLGFLGGTLDRGRLRLDALIEPDERYDEGEVLDRMLRSLLPEAARTGADELELWGHPAWPFHEAVARSHDMVLVRALHQMRCSLPVDAEVLPSRPFRPGDDDEAVLAVNNRAFRDHPDQGGLTLEDLRARFAEPWFDPDGLRIHEHDGQVAGFCWTKVHHDEGLGEIYVIGIDPAYHGQGLGAPMTAAGLRWLADHGLETGMLYVEADNEPAVRTYRRLGFSPFRTDRAWRLALG